MLTSISPLSLTQVADVFVKNKCVTGFNLDGGGSTSFFYKNAGSKSVTKVKCSDNNSSCNPGKTAAVLRGTNGFLYRTGN